MKNLIITFPIPPKKKSEAPSYETILEAIFPPVQLSATDNVSF